MADTQDLIVKLTMENGQFNAAVVKSDKALKKTEKTSGKLTKGIKKLRLAYIAVAGVLAGAIVKGLTSVIKRASDAQETLQKFGVVFKKNINDANAAVKELNRTFGLSRQEARTLLSDTGDLLTGFGFTAESALDLSTEVQKLAVDLASFTNIEGGAQRASEALTKALLGEREQVKALGIAILEEDVKAKIAALEATGRFTNETERQKKAIATLEIAVSQSQNALGDFQRSQGSLANQARILQGALGDIIIAIGEKLLPVITPVVTKLNEFANTDERIEQVADATFRVVNAFGAILSIIGVIGSAIKNFLIDPLITTADLSLRLLKILNPFATDTREQILKLGEAFEGIGEFDGIIDGLGNTFTRLKNVINGVKTSADDAKGAVEDLGNKGGEAAKKLTDQQRLQVEAFIQNEVSKTDAAIAEGERLLEFEALSAKQKTAIEKELAELKNQLEEEKTAKIISETQKRLSTLSEFSNQSVQLSQGVSDLTNNLIDATTKNEEEAEKKKREARRATAIFEKISSIFSVGVNTARAITGFLADPGGYPGIGLSIGAGVTGAIQAAAIASKPIPGFEDGGVISGLSGNGPGNEDGIIAAQNGESVLNRQATAILGIDAINALNEGRGIQPNVNITVNSNNGSEVVNTLNDYFKSFGGARQVGIG